MPFGLTEQLRSPAVQIPKIVERHGLLVLRGIRACLELQDLPSHRCPLDFGLGFRVVPHYQRRARLAVQDCRGTGGPEVPFRAICDTARACWRARVRTKIVNQMPASTPTPTRNHISNGEPAPTTDPLPVARMPLAGIRTPAMSITSPPPSSSAGGARPRWPVESWALRYATAGIERMGSQPRAPRCIPGLWAPENPAPWAQSATCSP